MCIFHISEINECASHPCMNGATCVDLFNRYNCDCLDGDSGKHCEIGPTVTLAPKIQLISEKTVPEGTHDLEISCYAQGIPTPVVTWEEIDYGTCHDGVNGYTYSCKDGFDGVNCDTEINECASHPCMKGATCVDLFNRYNCDCLDGDSGKHCEIGPTVTLAPKIQLISEKTVPEGTHDLEIACYAQGIPTPVVTWEEIDTKFQPNVRQIGHFLVMENVTMADKGYYTCTAKNRVGTDNKVVRVIVYDESTNYYNFDILLL
ncbi:NOTCH1 [Mytilus coruscus]|uniref:NOTCH1 n=1 Tax=Mytilus coruscus TaxID=42192 RepID=A0A6J8AP65_MYTCO|nr:NOTCH1 [Mytilus coruscus]